MFRGGEGGVIGEEAYVTTMVAVAATSIHGGQFFHGKYFSWGGNLVTPLVDRISEFLFVLNCNYGHIVYGVSFLRLIEITVENRDLFHILLHNPALGKTAANIFVIFFFHNRARSLAQNVV